MTPDDRDVGHSMGQHGLDEHSEVGEAGQGETVGPVLQSQDALDRGLQGGKPGHGPEGQGQESFPRNSPRIE